MEYTESKGYMENTESESRSRSAGVGVPESNLWNTRSLKYGKHGV